MRKIIIDGGANIGQSTKAFCRALPDISEYEIFCFEASQSDNILDPLKDQIEKSKAMAKDVTLINKAVWTEEGHITFYDKGTESSSITYRDQFINNPQVKQIKIPCIDISSWIQENFNKDDYIILKLDIEGAEYGVFEKLCDDDIVPWFDKIYAEIHGVKTHNTYEETMDMIEMVNGFGKEILMWGDIENFGPDGQEWKRRVYNSELIQKEFHKWYMRTMEEDKRTPFNLNSKLISDVIRRALEEEWTYIFFDFAEEKYKLILDPKSTSFSVLKGV